MVTRTCLEMTLALCSCSSVSCSTLIWDRLPDETLVESSGRGLLGSSSSETSIPSSSARPSVASNSWVLRWYCCCVWSV